MEELKRQSNARVAVIEEIEQPQMVEESSVQEIEEVKKETAKSVLFQNNSPEQYFQRMKSSSVVSAAPKTQIQLEATETFFIEKPEINTPKPVQETFIQPEIEEIAQPAIVEEINEPEIEKVEEVEDISEEVKKTARKPNLKARLKIITFGFFAVLACFIGWSIYNAVEIKTLTAEMDAANKTYSVNIVSYISNISKADDLTNENSIFNLEELSNAEVVPVTPSEIKNPTEYTVKSNWFNRLCNWLSNIFK